MLCQKFGTAKIEDADTLAEAMSEAADVLRKVTKQDALNHVVDFVDIITGGEVTIKDDPETVAAWEEWYSGTK